MAADLLQLLEHRIESNIQQRLNPQANRRLLKQYLLSIKKNKKITIQQEIATISRVCDWYRRMNLFEEGYRWVVPKGRFTQNASTDTIEGARLLWTARFLSWMGAPALSWRLLSSLKPRSEVDHRIVASLYLENFQYQEAWNHTEKMIALNSSPSDYRYRVSLLNGSDALCELGRTPEAVKLARKVFKISKEPLLKAMAQSALAQYFILSNDLKQASLAIEQAEKLFPESDQSSLDRAILLRWRGELQIKSGHLKLGHDSMRAAADIFKRAEARPEAYLKIIEVLSSYRLTTPAEELLLNQYPGLTELFYERIERKANTSRNIKALLQIDLHRDELHERKDTHQGFQASVYVPLEAKALAYICLSGNFGISKMRLGSILWPDQPFAVSSFSERIRKLLGRIHKIYGIKITPRLSLKTCGEQRFSLSTEIRKKIQVTPIHFHDDRRPSFLIKNADNFQADAVGKYYRLSRAQQFRIITKWREKGYFSL